MAKKYSELEIREKMAKLLDQAGNGDALKGLNIVLRQLTAIVEYTSASVANQGFVTLQEKMLDVAETLNDATLKSSSF